MAGYTRNDTSNNIATGNVINAADLDGEFDALVAAFHASTGHTHDGTAANGAPITKIGPVQDLVISTGAITPKTDNTVDLGSSSFEFKDLYIDGTANIDALVADTADINAGTIDGTAIGANSASTGAFTTLSASSTVTLSGGTANGVLYLNGSKVATSGSALTFNGSTLATSNANASFTSGSSSTAGVITSGAAGTQGVIQFGSGQTTYNIQGGPDYVGNVYNVATGSSHQWAIATSEQMRLTSTGLGIGTSSPATKLQVVGTATFGDGTNGQIRLTSNSSLNYFDSLNNAASAWQNLTQRATVFDWFTAVSGTPSTGMRLDSSGNLGIGTSSPGVKLDIFEQRPNDNTRSTFRISVESAPGNQYAARIAAAKAVGGQPYMLVMGPADNNGHLAFTTGASDTERMRIDSSGNLGLGVTPSAWGGEPAFELRQAAALFGFSSTTNLLQNAFYNGSNWIYKNTAGAMLYQVGRDAHRWYTAPSGTAGNAISFTQAMTLHASGGLSVGNTLDPGAKSFNLGFQNGVGNLVGAFNFTGYIAGYGAGIASYVPTGSPGVDYQDLRFYTSAGPSFINTERARITSGGDLLVGTTSGATSSAHNIWTGTGSVTTLYVRNTNSTQPNGIVVGYSAAAPNDASHEFLYCIDTGANPRASIRSNGGLANYSANNVNLSDARLKTDVQDAESYLAKICAIPIKTYLYKDQTDTERNLGVLAQDVDAVAPELVDHSGFGKPPEGEDPYLSIYQTDLQYALMKCIQEQQAIITSLTARVALLEGTQP